MSSTPSPSFSCSSDGTRMAGSPECDGCLGTRRCWACGGSGRVEFGSGLVPCLRCEGSGTCPMCRGAQADAADLPLVTVAGDAVIVRPHGDQDIATADGFRRGMNEALACGQLHIVVDLEEVKFIDITCIGVVAVAAVRQRSRGGDVSVVHLPDAAKRAIQLLGHGELLNSRWETTAR